VAVAGATGYIGKAVVRECVRRGYKTKAFVRPESVERAAKLEQLQGAEVRGSCECRNHKCLLHSFDIQLVS
jgi:divinyl chlorophyllide a 8-vinyl-reductase